MRTDLRQTLVTPNIEPTLPKAASLTADAIASDETLLLENQLSFAIYKNANKISRLYRASLEPFGLTFPQYLALLALWGRPPCTVGDLSRALNLESNTLTPLLKRLETIGYVTRQRDRDDERCVRITLTTKGSAFRAEAAAIRARLVSHVGVAEQDIAALKTTLQQLSEQIDAATGTFAAPERSTAPAESVSEDDREP